MEGGWTSSRAAQQGRDQPARSAASTDGVDSSEEPINDAPPPLSQHRGRRRHCWVVLDDIDPMPGVVAAWARTETGVWQARVSYVLGDATGGVVTGWLPAAMLRPHDATLA